MFAAALLIAPRLITLSEPPTALFRLEPVLTKAFGRTVDVAPELETEVIVLHVRGVGVEALKGRIADAVCGMWVEEGGRLVLMLDRQEERRLNEIVVQRLSKALVVRISEEKKESGAYSLDRLLQQLDKGEWQVDGPGPYRYLEVLEGIGSEKLARALLFEPTSYATNPTKFEQSLPAPALEAVEQFREDWRELSKALSKRGWTTRDNQSELEVRAERFPDVGLTPQFRIGLEAKCRPFRSFDSRVYCGVGLDHTIVQSSWLNHELDAVDRTMTWEIFEQGVLMSNAWKPEPLKSRHFSTITKRRQSWALEKQAYLKELIDYGRRRLKPVSAEPLEDIYAESFAEWAEAEGAQLCALVSDSWFDINEEDFRGTKYADPHKLLYPEPPLLEAEAGEFLEWRIADGWLTCRSWVPQWERERRMNRRMTAKAVDLMKTGPWPTFEQAAADDAWRRFAFQVNRATSSQPAFGRMLAENSGSAFAHLTAETLSGFADKKPRRFRDLPKEDQDFIIEATVRDTGYVEWRDNRMVITDPDGSRRQGPFPPAGEMHPSFRFARDDWDTAMVEYREDDKYPIWWGWEEIDLKDQAKVPPMTSQYSDPKQHAWCRSLGTGWVRRLFLEVKFSEQESLEMETFYYEHDQGSGQLGIR